MYVLKNAFISMTRSAGRNALIGLIIFVIAISSCIGLSIRQASETAKKNTMDAMTISAQISFDRTAMMGQMQNPESGSGFDKNAFREQMMNMESLSLEDMQTYATADSVKSFYYTLSVSMNGDDSFEAVTNTIEGSSGETTQEMPNNRPSDDFGGKGGNRFAGSMGTQGDFTIVGYSSDEAMTSFLNGTCSVTDGSMFEEGTTAYQCMISDELATFNDLSVNDVITLVNPNAEEETYELTIAGIYKNTQSTVGVEGMMGGFSAGNDAANQIYMSAASVSQMIASSEKAAEVSVDETTGRETTTAIASQLSGTYTFSDIESYEAFQTDVYDMGLSESYTVSSSDVTSFEQSMLPLENLSKMALYFLVVVLGIGAIVLIAINIFSVRERKYEVGVLTAIGMKKAKVCVQFLLETLMVTAIAIALGAIVGSAVSVPVTNSLLENQIEAQSSKQESQEMSFGRNPMQGGNRFMGASEPITYVSEVTEATNMVVLIQLIGIGFALTFIASVASMVFIMRYNPLLILSNRD